MFNHPESSPTTEEGFALIALVVVIFIILLVLAVAAPKVARDLQRDRELEAVHRGNDYVRAIQLFYRKFNRYPTSIEQLEKTNDIRFLRRRWIDPLTGKADWRIIPVGQNKTTVKGLFGQPLAGLATSGIGSGIGGPQTVNGGASGGSSGGSTFGGSTGGSSFGSSSFGGSSGSSFGSSGSSFGSSSAGGSTFGATTVNGTANPTSGTSGVASQSATAFQGSAGPFMGIGSSKAGESIISLNEQTDYNKWEFLYDPRIEQLKAKSNLFGGGGAAPSGISGTSTPGSSTGNGSLNDFNNTPGTNGINGTNPTAPNPNAPIR